jgi:hypothetical protein
MAQLKFGGYFPYSLCQNIKTSTGKKYLYSFDIGLNYGVNISTIIV